MHNGRAMKFFVNKAVRDLHWALASPHVLSADAVPVVSESWCENVVARSLPWLQQLDADPTPLESWLRSQRNVRRLGFYFAALLEFWVRHSPALSLTSSSTPADHGMELRQVLAQQQIHAGIDGQCAGQLKLVFERIAGKDDTRTEFAHWESHVKFFAFCGGEAASPAVLSLDGGAASSSDVSQGDAGLAEYIGPFLGENLLHRVAELRRKLSLSEAPAVRQFLGAHFNRGTTEPEVRPEAVVRGYLFYPLGSKGFPAAAAGTGTAEAANTITSDSTPSGPKPAKTHLHREAPAPAVCTSVGARHARGWWTRSLDALLEAMPAESLWALPGNGAGVRDDACGALGGKLHWLAPAIAVQNSWNGPEGRQGGRARGLSIRGIPSLGVDDCPLMTAVELREALEEWSRAPSATPMAVAGKTSSSASASYIAAGANESAAVLLLQMMPLMQPEDGTAATGSRAAQQPGASASAAVWVEASRGFLMPSDWDPAPLMRAAPLGLRSGMRQKQRDRVASGGAILVSDYSISEGTGAIDIGRLAVRMGEGGFGPRRSPSPDDPKDTCTGHHDRAVDESVHDGNPTASDGSCCDQQGGNNAIAGAVIAEVASSWQKLSPPVLQQLRRLSLGLLVASTCSQQVYGDSSISDLLVSHEQDADATTYAAFEAAVRDLFSLDAVTGKREAGANGQQSNGHHAEGKERAKTKGSSKGGNKNTAKAANSQFSLAKLVIAHSISRSRGAVGAISMLRRLLGSGEQQHRFLASLVVAGLAQSGELRSDHEAASQCAKLMEDAMRGSISVPASLLVEAVTLCDGRAHRHSHVSDDHLVLDADIAKSYLQSLLSMEESATLRNASQLMRQLRLIGAMDGESVLRRLVDANQWVHAEQFAVAASEEEDANKETEAKYTTERTPDQASAAVDASTNEREADHAAYLDLQRAAKAATVATVQSTAMGTPPSPADEVASVRRVAAALGGYIKRSERLPIDGKSSRPHVDKSAELAAQRAEITAFVDGGLSQPAPRAERLRSGMAIQRQLLPEVAQVMAISDGGKTNGVAARQGSCKLLRLLLTLAHQRSNGKLVARIGRLVGDEEGGVQAQRTAQIARLIGSGEVNLAVTFAGEDPGLQTHLVGLLCASGRPREAEQFARLRRLPDALLSAAMQGNAWSGSASGRQWEDAERPEPDSDGEDDGLTGSRTARNGTLPSYRMPADTIVEVFERPDEVTNAENVLHGMLLKLRAGQVPPLLGLDAEWVAGSQVSLVQLAIPSHCVLIRTLKLREAGCSLPPSLGQLLLEPTVLKLGVGVGHDLRLLSEHFGLSSTSVVELQALASREGFTGAGLQRLAAEVLGKHLDKSPELRWYAIRHCASQHATARPSRR